MLLALVVACQRPPPEPPVVAQWTGGVVRAPELKAELDRMRQEAGAEVRAEADKLPALRRALLHDLVDRRLLLAEAQHVGLGVTDEEVGEALTRTKGARAENAEPVTPERRARVREGMLVDRLLLREVAARVALGPEDSRAWYDAHPEEFAGADEVRARQILVATREEGEALKVELNRGADFGQLAKEHSSSADGKDGGDLGWFARGQLPPEFDEVCFALKKGQVSDVVQTPYGFHVFKVTDTRTRGPKPFAQVEAEIELRLKREAIARAQAAYVEKLRDKAGVSIIDAEVDKVQE